MANKIYVTPEAAITWRNAGGDNVLTLTSLAAGAGRQGALDDFGAVTPRSRKYNWRFFMQFATEPVVGEVIYIYGKTGDGTHRDNDDGAGDAAVSAEDKLRNLTLIGVLIVDEAAVAPEFSVSGDIEISSREFAPVIWNDTADAFSATAAEHGFDLMPTPDEIQ